MLDICVYLNKVPFDNSICNNCKDFQETCQPIIDTIDGYSSTSECDIFLCEGCSHEECLFHSFINN